MQKDRKENTTQSCLAIEFACPQATDSNKFLENDTNMIQIASMIPRMTKVISVSCLLKSSDFQGNPSHQPVVPGGARSDFGEVT